MLYFDPMAIVIALVFIVAFVLIGSRFFPEDMRVHLWRYDRQYRPSPGVREDDDARFNWGQHEPGGGDDR